MNTSIVDAPRMSNVPDEFYEKFFTDSDNFISVSYTNKNNETKQYIVKVDAVKEDRVVVVTDSGDYKVFIYSQINDVQPIN